MEKDQKRSNRMSKVDREILKEKQDELRANRLDAFFISAPIVRQAFKDGVLETDERAIIHTQFLSILDIDVEHVLAIPDENFDRISKYHREKKLREREEAKRQHPATGPIHPFDP